MKTERIDNYVYSREGFLLTGIEEDEIPYLQTYADLVGPDREMNKRLRTKVAKRENWKHSISKTDPSAISITHLEDVKLDENCISVFRQINEPSIEIAKLIWKFHWINSQYNLPVDSRVLCIGANPGLECLIAQTLFPKWRITGVDFRVSNRPLFKNMLQMNIAEIGMFFPPNSFDLCFSNHVLEHLGPAQESVLQGVSKILYKNGCFASALPCEANPSYPCISNFFDLLDKSASRNMHLINPAHMWKTDIFNIYDLLKAHKFDNVHFFRFKGGGNDNNQAIFKQVPKEIVVHESFVSEEKSFNKKLLSGISRLTNVQSISELELRWYYHKLRKKFFDYHLVPEILFCCRSGR